MSIKEIVDNLPRYSIKGAKVVFINPPLREDAPPNCMPYGICLLASILRDNDAEPSILDLNAIRGRDVKELITTHLKKVGEPDVVAMSGIITTLKWQKRITKIVREILPDVFLVSGNGLATEFKGGLFNWIPELNAVACSEGDYSIIKIVYDALQIKKHGSKDASLSGKLAPYYLGMATGKLRFIYEGERPKDLDLLPFPAYDLLGRDVLETYIKNPIWGSTAHNSSATPFTMHRSVNMISSRGCPFACTYCFRGATGERNYGMRSAKSFADEVMFISKSLNADFVGILDDNFMVSKKRVIEFSKLMENANVNWGVHGRMDEAQDERVEAMGKGKCRYIGFGGESASEKTLREMGKGGFTLTNGMERIGGYSFPRTYVNAIKNTRKADISANCTWIEGYPNETLTEFKKTIAFILWQQDLCQGKQPVNKSIFIAQAYPGTEMFKHYKVREKLQSIFGIRYDSHLNPIVDEALYEYVLQLGDATKLLHGLDGRPVNFSEIPEDQFLKTREYIDSGKIERILNMS